MLKNCSVLKTWTKLASECTRLNLQHANGRCWVFIVILIWPRHFGPRQNRVMPRGCGPARKTQTSSRRTNIDRPATFTPS